MRKIYTLFIRPLLMFLAIYCGIRWLSSYGVPRVETGFLLIASYTLGMLQGANIAAEEKK
ncbi:MAG: hypothetical protein IJ042_09745 [Butyricicoccus sp.]|nr:hypothetical protein [Butyricicoccus sp.]